MSESQRIFKNTFYTTLFKVLGDVAVFVTFIYLARTYGKSNLGEYSFAIAFTGFIAILTNFGTDNFSIRAVAQDKSRDTDYFSRILTLGWFTVPLLSLVIYTLASLIGFTELRFSVVLIVGIYQVLLFYSEVVGARFKAHEQMFTYAGLNASMKFAILASMMTLGRMGYDFVYVLLPLPVCVLIYILVSLYIQRGRYSPLNFKIDFEFLRRVWPEVWVFGAGMLMYAAYSKIDMMMIGFLRDEAEVGIYAAAFRPVFGIVIIIFVASHSLYPVYSRLFLHDQNDLKGLFQRVARLALMMFVLLVFTMIYWANELIPALFGSGYQESILVLQMLACLILFSGSNAFFEPMLYATGLQKVRLKALLSISVLNICLNGLLIPRLGYIGAVITTVISESMLTAFYYYRISKTGVSPKVLNKLVFCLLAGLGLLVFAYLQTGMTFKSTGYVAGVLVFATICYVGKLWVAKDWLFVKELMARRKATEST